jgi:hypothetical protein
MSASKTDNRTPEPGWDDLAQLPLGEENTPVVTRMPVPGMYTAFAVGAFSRSEDAGLRTSSQPIQDTQARRLYMGYISEV